MNNTELQAKKERAPLIEAKPESAADAPTQEMEVSPEVQENSSLEQQPASLDSAIEGLKRGLKKAKKPKNTVVPVVRDDMTLQIETILSDGLEDAFLELTPVQQQEFKIKGEQAAFQIRQLLGATKVRVRKIFRVIVDWLKMLPGVNRYYLIQEAKIKTDQIMSLKPHDQ